MAEPTTTNGEQEAWKALESNPGVFTTFSRGLGLPESWGFVDIWGLDDDLLAFVPQPCVAVVLLFPSNLPTRQKIERPTASEVTDEAAAADPTAAKVPEGVFYLTQISDLGNACGTIAMLHGLGNNLDVLSTSGYINEFVASLESKTPLERGMALNNDETISNLHNSFAEEGDTASIPSEQVGHHFVCYVAIGDDIYELDGCNDGPVNRGPVTEEDGNFLGAAARIIKAEYMSANPEVMDFSMMALAATPAED